MHTVVVTPSIEQYSPLTAEAKKDYYELPPKIYLILADIHAYAITRPHQSQHDS